MANNKVFQDGWHLSVVCTDPAAPSAGDPVRYGLLTGVALTDESGGLNATGETTVDFGPGVWDIPVIDEVGGGIAAGDTVFYDDALDGLTNDPSGNYFFGFANEPVGAGLTATIQVIHVPSPGAGTLGAGTIATANLAVGILSADAAGRAKMAAGLFDAATVTSKFAVNTVTGREIKTGVVRLSLAAGTAAATNVVLAAMAAGDEIVSVLSFTTAAAIASVADRTSEYAAGAGVLTKAAGTDETGNQLVIVWIDKT